MISAASALLALSISLTPGTSVSACDAATIRDGLCTSGSIGTDSVTLDGTFTTPGNERETDAAVEVEGGDSDSDPNTFCMDRVGELTCWSVTPPAEAGSAPVTLADIAHFRPEIGPHTMEPGGWAIQGLPANFVSAASVHAVDGELFGTPASMRFTPVAWRWDYGDGSTSTPHTGGSRWVDLGTPEFSPTATSHVFEHPGTYRVTLTVDFRAEYRVGTGAWTPIAGTVPIAADALSLTVARATTVLVDGTCDGARPDGCA